MPSFPAFVIAFMWVLGHEFYFPPMVWENKEFDFRSDLSFLMFVALFKTLEGFFFTLWYKSYVEAPGGPRSLQKGLQGPVTVHSITSSSLPSTSPTFLYLSYIPFISCLMSGCCYLTESQHSLRGWTQWAFLDTSIWVPIQAKVSASWLQEGVESSCWKRNFTPPCIAMWPWWSLGSLTNTKKRWGCELHFVRV